MQTLFYEREKIGPMTRVNTAQDMAYSDNIKLSRQLEVVKVVI